MIIPRYRSGRLRDGPDPIPRGRIPGRRRSTSGIIMVPRTIRRRPATQPGRRAADDLSEYCDTRDRTATPSPGCDARRTADSPADHEWIRSTPLRPGDPSRGWRSAPSRSRPGHVARNDHGHDTPALMRRDVHVQIPLIVIVWQSPIGTLRPQEVRSLPTRITSPLQGSVP